MPIGTSQSTLTKLEVFSVDSATSGSLSNTGSNYNNNVKAALLGGSMCWRSLQWPSQDLQYLLA